MVAHGQDTPFFFLPVQLRISCIFCVLLISVVGSVILEISSRAYPVQRALALCGVWGRVSVASLTLACAMRGDRDSNPGPSGHRR